MLIAGARPNFLKVAPVLVGELRGARTLIIWVSAIGRGVAITIGASCVTPAPRAVNPVVCNVGANPSGVPRDRS
jgi:hypothetical protein